MSALQTSHFLESEPVPPNLLAAEKRSARVEVMLSYGEPRGGLCHYVADFADMLVRDFRLSANGLVDAFLSIAAGTPHPSGHGQNLGRGRARRPYLGAVRRSPRINADQRTPEWR